MLADLCFGLMWPTLLTSLVLGQQTGPGPECLCFQQLDTPENGLNMPTKIAHGNDGSGRLFVSDQQGYIWIYRQDGSRDVTPFLNFTSSSDLSVSANGGLLAFALHPDFAVSGLVYLSYTVRAEEEGFIYQRVSELVLSGTDPNVLDPSTERIVLDVFNADIVGHMGGAFTFGDDGYMYFAVGDGNCCYDPFENAQNKSTFQGSMLRIDVDSRTGELRYGIPPDNPFLDDPEARPEIFAIGLRNPWTSSVDIGDRVTGEGRGRMFLGDIGEVSYEEINLMTSGANYGWPIYEANLCLGGNESCNDTFEPPVVSYNRSVGICVIYGGIYRGCELPDLNNWMISVDYGSKFFIGAVETSPGVWSSQIVPTCESCPDGLTNDKQVWIITMGADEAGEYYFGATDSLDPYNARGNIYKVVDPNNPGNGCN